MDTRSTNDLSDRLTIATQEQAAIVADAFIKKVEKIYQKLNHHNQLKNDKIAHDLRSFNPERIDAILQGLNPHAKEALDAHIRVLQRKWKAGRKTDTLLGFNRHGFHQDNVTVFVNNQKILMNRNAHKQARLLHAYRNQDWNDEIYADPLFLETALALFAAGKFKDAEFETLLIFHYSKITLPSYTKNPNKFNLVKAHPILDEHHEFTEEAKELLLPNLPGFMKQKFDSVQIRNFQLIAQAFFESHPSENVFFTVNSGEFYKDALGKILARLKATLYNSAGRSNPIDDYFLNNDEQDYIKIVVSCLAENALQLAFAPIEDVVPVRSVAGNLLIADIEKSVDAGLRPGAVSFNQVPANKDIHSMTNTSNAARRDHDFYHAQHMTRAGYTVLQAMKRVKDLSRTEILVHCPQLKDQPHHKLFSTATWQLIDGEFTFFNDARQAVCNRSHAAMVQNFCHALDSDTPNAKRTFLLFGKGISNGITDLGIITFIDMAKNIERWKSFDFDPAYLIDQYKDGYNTAKTLLPFLTDDSKYNIILFRAYKILAKEHFAPFMASFKDCANDLNQSFEFKRNNKTGFLGLVDKTLKKQPAKNMYGTLLLCIEKQYQAHVDFDYELYEHLFKNMLLLRLHVAQYPAVMKHVYNPMRDLLFKMLENPDEELDYSSFKACNDKLYKFIKFHRNNPNSEVNKATVAILSKITHDLSQFIHECKPETNGYRY